MKNKKLIIDIFKALIVFIVFFCSSFIKRLLCTIFDIKIKGMSTSTNLLLTFIVYVIIIALFIILYGKEFKVEWKNFTSKLGKNLDTSLKYYGIGFLGMIFFNIIINFILKLGQSQNENAVQSLIKAAPFFMIVYAGILGPIVEELVFRKSFKNVFKNKWVFVIVSGILFGFVHIVGFELKTPLEFLYILPYGSLGAMFAYMDYEVDSTFPSITMHMLHNTVLVILSVVLKIL